jgi:ABC-type transport system substrate-binding protein
MTTRRLLILAPLFISLVLLQSYFWVPSYEEQARGNPQRLREFVSASIGDASLLNPILSADASSSEIESKVFEGLIDRDEELRFRGRLASGWTIYEAAYFYVNENAAIPGSSANDAQAIVRLLREKRRNPAGLPQLLQQTLANISEITLLPPQTYSIQGHLSKTADAGSDRRVEWKVEAPARIRMTLNEVDQDLFSNLALLLGDEYFRQFPATRYLKSDIPVSKEIIQQQAPKILPAVEHNPIIEFALRPGVRFHDGHLLDADDVRFTYEAIMDPRNLSPRVADYEPVKTVEVVDSLTIRIIYKRLYSPAFGTWGMGILPEHLLNDSALEKEALRRGKDPADFSIRDSEFNRRPIGCGPFVFREWQSDQYIILDRFEDYWEGPPNYEKFAFRVIPDLLTQEMEFYAGTIDSYSVQPHQVKRLKKDPRFQYFSGTSFGYSYIGYNLRRKPFDDVRVRRALGMAIDVDKIIEYVLYDQGERITGPFVIQTDFYNHAIRPLPYNPEEALRLLAEAGWRRSPQGWLEKDGRRMQFTLITNSGNDIRKAILAIAQDSWKQIGIDVRTDLLEWSVFIQERVNKLDFDALILGWSMGIDPDLFQIWHSSQTHPHQLNFVGFQNKEADDLIIKIRQEYDHDRQVADCHRLHRIIADEQPYTFLFVGRWTAILDKRIVVQEIDETGGIAYRKITPTKTGNYMFDFNKWVKLPQMPDLNP